MADLRSPGASIGRPPPRPAREVRSESRLEAALRERGFLFRGIEPSKIGRGVIAIADGKGGKVLMHLGRDATDARYNLAALATRPAGREW